jgi:hypothetical protein
MINPPLELIRSAITPADENRRRLRNQDSNGYKEIPALVVRIKPGTYSQDINLSMSYNITSYE